MLHCRYDISQVMSSTWCLPDIVLGVLLKYKCCFIRPENLYRGLLKLCQGVTTLFFCSYSTLLVVQKFFHFRITDLTVLHRMLSGSDMVFHPCSDLCLTTIVFQRCRDSLGCKSWSCGMSHYVYRCVPLKNMSN